MTVPRALSLIFIAFEQEAFVRDAVRSVLGQDCAPAEVLIADDASSDRTFEIIDEECRAYRGPHAVRWWRNEKNLVSENVQKCVAESSGDILVMFHGDDVSDPRRSRRLAEIIGETGASLVSSNAVIVDRHGAEAGTILGDVPSGRVALEEAAFSWDRRMLGATHAMTREVFDAFAPWDRNTVWGAWDHVLPFRATLLGGMYYVDEVLLRYRQHDRNMGKGMSDWTQGEAIDLETRLATYLTARVFMRDNLVDYLDRNPNRSDLTAFVELMSEDLMQNLRAWSNTRNALLSSGGRPTWTDRAEMERRAAGLPPRSVGHGMALSKRIRLRLARELSRVVAALS